MCDSTYHISQIDNERHVDFALTLWMDVHVYDSASNLWKYTTTKQELMSGIESATEGSWLSTRPPTSIIGQGRDANLCKLTAPVNVLVFWSEIWVHLHQKTAEIRAKTLFDDIILTFNLMVVDSLERTPPPPLHHHQHQHHHHHARSRICENASCTQYAPPLLWHRSRCYSSQTANQSGVTVIRKI